MVNAAPSRPGRGQGIGLDCRRAGRIGNMQKRQRYGGFDLWRQFMHGVGTQHDAVGATGLQAARGVLQDQRSVIPAPGVLGLFHRTEVDAVQQDLCRAQRPQPVAYPLAKNDDRRSGNTRRWTPSSCRRLGRWCACLKRIGESHTLPNQ